jgi:hypothetical protein
MIIISQKMIIIIVTAVETSNLTVLILFVDCVSAKEYRPKQRRKIV